MLISIMINKGLKYGPIYTAIKYEKENVPL